MERFVYLQAGDYRATIDLYHGANCISLRNLRYNACLLREPENPDRLDNPYLYGMPILFPVNRISGGQFVFEGRKYRFPVNEPTTGCHLHGLLHCTEFVPLEISDNKLLCVYRANGTRPYMQFPHSFEVRIGYELTKDGLKVHIAFTNLSGTNMPILLGLHTTFVSCFTSQSQPSDILVKVPISAEYARNMDNYLPTGETPPLDTVGKRLHNGLFNPFSAAVSRHYRSAGQGKMVIYDRGQDLSLVYENDEKFHFRLIYNGNADGYICLEPQTCLVNCPNLPVGTDESGLDWIAPGQTKKYISRIYLAEGDRR